MLASSIGSVYQEGIVDAGKEPAFLFLVAFLASFAFIRTSAHMIRAQVSWWPGKEVYWSEEGRKSIDAVIVAAILAGFGVLGFSVLADLADDLKNAVLALIGAFGLANLAIVAINLAKEKFVLGAVGLLVPPVALVGRGASRQAHVAGGTLLPRGEGGPGQKPVRSGGHRRALSTGADRPGGSAAGRSLESEADDPSADQPRATPSPPPPGGIALGGASAARAQGNVQGLREGGSRWTLQRHM